MWRAGLSVVVGIATCLSFAAPAQAGGGGTVSITRTNGTVLIRPVDFQSGRALGPWRSATKDVLVGTYLMRTGRGSWAHVSLPFGIRQRGRWRYLPGGCVDGSSLIRIDSYADSAIRVLRGKLSPLDGKRTGRLPNQMGWGTS